MSVGAIGAGPAAEQTLHWERLDVEISALRDGSLAIQETWDVAFTEGAFTFGFREIPLDRIDGIESVRVREVGREYRPGSGEPYSYETSRQGGDLQIRWTFPELQDQRRTFVLSYLARGAIRVYEGGDQVFWKAIFADRDFSRLGLDLKALYLNAILPTEETVKAIDERAAMGAIGNMEAYLQFKAARALGEAAATGAGDGGSLTGAGFGLGAGAGLGAMMAQMMGQAMHGGHTRTCPNCSAVIPAHAKFCPQCGAKIGGSSICPNCKAEVAEGSRYCHNCGTQLG